VALASSVHGLRLVGKSPLPGGDDCAEHSIEIVIN
jgi:hypothetical protein